MLSIGINFHVGMLFSGIVGALSLLTASGLNNGGLAGDSAIARYMKQSLYKVICVLCFELHFGGLDQ